jgi:hypothetical protein
MLDIEIDKNFFKLNVVKPSKKEVEDNGYWQKNLEKKYTKELKNGHISLYIYKKKYNVFFNS